MIISLIISTIFFFSIAITILFIINNWREPIFTEFESVKIIINRDFIDIINLNGMMIACIHINSGDSNQFKSISIIEASEIQYIKDNYKQIYEFYKNK